MIDNIDNIFSGLNEKQKEAAQHKNGPLIIIAGAGSGKTRVITQRVAYLIASGIAPWNILALTFTNKAAKELKIRISKIVSEDTAAKIWAGTFHSIFAKILRFEAQSIGYDSNFTIYDADDQLAAIKTVMNKLLIAHQSLPPQQVRSRISNAKNQMKSVAEFKNQARTTFDKQVGFIYEVYEQYLKQNNAMDFDDLILKTIDVLESSQQVLRKYQEKFRYLLVDEYQDTNKAQYIVINLLAKAHQNLCVVGDDAQSIYKWRGADIKNILEFEKDYPNSKIVRLEQNYRSTKNILAAADSLIKNNKNQLPKTIWSDNKDGDLIDIIDCEDERDEASRIVNIIKSKISKDHDYRSFAVLYRTNAQALPLENALRINNIPYVIVGGVSFFKRKEIKDTLAYLRLLINKRDDESLYRVINEPPRGIGNTTLQHVRDFASNKGTSIYVGLINSEQITSLQARAVNAILKFVKLIENYTQVEKDGQFAELIYQYIEATGLPEMYREMGTDDANDRWNNIQQLLNDLRNFFNANPEGSLSDYLQQVTLLSDYDEKDTSGNHVTIMTLHSAKGLEFPIVFLTGLERGLFPMIRDDSDDIEEERRLMYVGITRAEEKLYITYAKRRTKFGETQECLPSQFLKELNFDVLNWKAGAKAKEDALNREYSQVSYNRTAANQIFGTTKPKPNFSQNANNYSQVNDDYNYSQVAQPSILTEKYKLGDNVQHSNFGLGVVTGMKGEGDMKQITVRFNSVGKKSLMLKYAKLIKV